MQPSAGRHGPTAIAVATDAFVTDAAAPSAPPHSMCRRLDTPQRKKRVENELGQGAYAQSPEHAQPSEILQPVRISPPRKEATSLLMLKELSHVQPAPVQAQEELEGARAKTEAATAVTGVAAACVRVEGAATAPAAVK